MLQVGITWLLGVTVLGVIAADDHYQVFTKKEIITKGKPVNVSLLCNMDQRYKKCTWTLVPLAKSISSDDLPSLMDNFVVKVDTLLRLCFLNIYDLKFKDHGLYDCSLDNEPRKVGWNLIILGNPGSPSISYSNGTAIEDDIIVVDETPVTISLTCQSSGAWPEYEDVYWSIDERISSQNVGFTQERKDGLWSVRSNISVYVNATEDPAFRVKRVTCFTRHTTRTAAISKIIGIRNPNQTVHLMHIVKKANHLGRLKCFTDMFPWPILYEIIRIPDHPPCNVDKSHHGKEMDVEEEGHYICRVAVLAGRTLITQEIIFKWVESNVVGIGDAAEPECPLTTESVEEALPAFASEAQFNDATDTASFFISEMNLTIYLVAVNILLLQI